MNAIDEASALGAVQHALRNAIAAAPWPRALSEVVTDLLSEPKRVLGGRLTPVGAPAAVLLRGCQW